MRLKRLTTLPSLPTRNFSKFHAMSERHTGVQRETVVPPQPPRGRISASISAQPLPLVSDMSPSGIIISDLSHLKRGAASAPLTSVFAKMVIAGLTSKPSPGRTYLSVLRNSPSPSLVWWPNWLHGKPRMATLSPYFSARAFIAVKSWTVVPHRDATFKMSPGLSLNSLIDTGVPSILSAEKSYRDMSTAARADAA